MFEKEDNDFDTARLYNKMKQFDNSELQKKSPEINSLSKFQLDGTEQLIFISTNTPVSIACGEALSKYYRNNDFKTTLITLENFTGKETKTQFRKGIAEYVNVVLKLVSDGNTKYYYDTYINVTSGYRSLIPYSTIIGTVFNCNIFYLYETYNHIETLPPFPIEFNYSIFDEHEKYFTEISRDLMKKEHVLNYFGYEKFIELIPQILIEEEGYVYLSALGEILWGKYKSENPLIYVSKDVLKTIEKEPKKKKLIEKMLRNEGEPDHNVILYNGKYKFYKFSAKSERIVYDQNEHGDYHIVRILDHAEYDRYIENKGIKENPEFIRKRIKLTYSKN